jgi:hypothetical protein
MFSKEEIKRYYRELEELPRKIESYKEVNNNSYANRLEKRLKEVEFIIDNLESQQLLNNARKIISEYQRRYGKIEVIYENRKQS